MWRNVRIVRSGEERSISGKKTVHAKDAMASPKQVFVRMHFIQRRRIIAKQNQALAKLTSQHKFTEHLTSQCTDKMCLPGLPGFPYYTIWLISFVSFCRNLEWPCLLTSPLYGLTRNVSATGPEISHLVWHPQRLVHRIWCNIAEVGLQIKFWFLFLVLYLVAHWILSNPVWSDEDRQPMQPGQKACAFWISLYSDPFFP